jgi:calpain, invertebrate
MLILGDHHEWRGAWSDESPEWRSIDNNLKEKLGLKNEEDGKFK